MSMQESEKKNKKRLSNILCFDFIILMTLKVNLDVVDLNSKD